MGVIDPKFWRHNPSFYRKGAPPDTFAAGFDYGRRWVGGERQIDLGDVSTLEALVLATHRLHHVSVKLRPEGEGKEIDRTRLTSKTIIFPQSVDDVANTPAAETALAAAFGQLHVIFIGPLGVKTSLEHAALKVRDLRLEPHVVYNGLAMGAFLHGDAVTIPPWEKLCEVYCKEAVLQHVRAKASEMTDPLALAVDNLAKASDITNTRLNGMDAGHAEEARGDAGRGDVTIEQSYIGVFKPAQQEMSHFLAGIDKAISRADEGADGADGAADGADGGAGGDGDVARGAGGGGGDATGGEGADGESSGGGRCGGGGDAPRPCINARGDVAPGAPIEEARAGVAAARAGTAAASASGAGAAAGGADGADGTGDRDGAGSAGGAGGADEAGGGADGAGAGGDRAACGGADGAGGAEAERGNAAFRRAADPTNDYDGAAEALYGAWRLQFPLRAGLKVGAPLSDQQMRRLALFFDCRFAHRMDLIFHLADVRMRHAVNKSVAARCVSTPEAFRKFAELVNDGPFRELLAQARENPKGPEATKVLRRVLPFINLCSSRVPWSGGARAHELTRHLAIARYCGHGSVRCGGVRTCYVRSSVSDA